MRLLYSIPAMTLLALHALLSCGQNNANQTPSTNKQRATANHFTEGKDYQVFERVRLLDRVGFTEPQEAYSILLPKGWKHNDEIIWNPPGSSCAGTFSRMKAVSPDNNSSIEVFPDVLFLWNTNPQMMQFQQQNSGNCSAHEPFNAEQYLRNIFVHEIGNPQIIKVEENAGVVAQMSEHNAAAINELRQYGGGQMQFHQTAINAEVKWNDGSMGLITLGVSVLEGDVPNVYDGTSSKIYTTQVTKRTLFKFPVDGADMAKSQFSAIMSSVRTNPAWKDAVNKFWKDARQQSHVAHVGKIKMMDEQTRRMGEQTIRNGEQRLRDMDNNMRSWEKQQSSKDYMHTEFVKTIREVENCRDESGKYEMSAGYDHAWSRGDGNSFILSNSPTFDPAAVLQDQNWKEMKKVH